MKRDVGGDALFLSHWTPELTPWGVKEEFQNGVQGGISGWLIVPVGLELADF